MSYMTKLSLNYNIFLDDSRNEILYILLIEKVNHCRAFVDCVRPRTMCLSEIMQQ